MKLETDAAGFSEINVTPMVDVMLVLMIIFMVAAPMLQQGISVKLPKAKTGQSVDSGGLVIALTKENVLYVDGDAVTLQELRRQLASRRGQGAVTIRADRYAYVNHLMDLWDLCRELGFREIHIATLAE